MATDFTLQALYKRYLDGHTTAEEEARLLAHFREAGQQTPLRELIEAELNQAPPAAWEQQPRVQAAFRRVQKHLMQHIRQPKIKRSQIITWLYASAAILLVVAGTSLYLHYQHQKQAALAALPKGPLNQAILTLADGTKITLDKAKAGIQVNDEGIYYNDGTKIKAASRNSSGSPLHTDIHHSSSITYNSLITPKGGQYQVILEDGTKVWLNVASTLKYPSRFTGNKREVFLTGEAYFEIAKSQEEAGTFSVKTPHQTITVLGTRFNLQAYADEPQEKTALISGSVKVTGAGQETLLKPEQQAVLKDGQIHVQEFDPEAMTAWKNGVFRFQGEDIYSVMRQMARWYGVRITYQGHFRSDRLGGAISRQASLQEALLTLEELGVARFEVSGDQITVVGDKN